MGILVNVNEAQPIPTVVPIGTANVLVVGYDDANDSIFDPNSAPVGAAGLGERVMKITSYAEFLSAYKGDPADTPLKKWVETYFNELAGQGADPAFLYLYRFKTTDSGGTFNDQVALPGMDLSRWKTDVAPIATIVDVKVSYDGGTPVTQAYPAAYDKVEDENGLFTGEIIFKAGYPVDELAAYRAVNLQTDTVTISYTTVALASAFKVTRQVDVQFVSLAYDPGRMKISDPIDPLDGIYNGDSLVEDMQQLVAHCNQSSDSGFYRMAVVGLPANALPSDSAADYGGSGKWQDLRQLDVGQSRNFVEPFSPRMPTLNTSGYKGQWDNGAYLAALIRKNPVRTDVAYTINTTATQPHENEALQWAFKNARIGTIVSASHLIDATHLNFGFTFGIGRQRWINNMRCRYQIKHLIEARLYRLMLSKPGVPYNAEGGYKIMNTIAAAIETAKLNGWCEGLADKDGIVIPILPYLLKANRTPTEQEMVDNAADSGIWTGIKVAYKWSGNTEQINISNLTEVQP